MFKIGNIVKFRSIGGIEIATVSNVDHVLNKVQIKLGKYHQWVRPNNLVLVKKKPDSAIYNQLLMNFSNQNSFSIYCEGWENLPKNMLGFEIEGLLDEYVKQGLLIKVKFSHSWKDAYYSFNFIQFDPMAAYVASF